MKKPNKNRLWKSAILLFFWNCVLGQLPFESFTEGFETVPVYIDEDLISPGAKRVFTEDKDGVMWIAADYGCLRFDGFQSINFSHYLQKKFPTVSSTDQMESVLVDEYDQLWLGSPRGLHVYNLKHNEYEKVFLDDSLYIENFRNKIKRLFLHKEKLYVSTFNGLYVVDIKTHEVKESYLTDGKKEESGGETNHSIQGVYPHYVDSLLLIQASDGMHIFNSNNGTHNTYTYDDLIGNEYFGKVGHWFYQGEIRDHTIISSTWNMGVMHFDIQKREFSCLLADPSRKLEPNRNIFKSTTAINDSLIILTGAPYGLHVYKYPERKLTHVKSGPYFGHQGYIDSHGHMWLGQWEGPYRSKRKLSKEHGKFRSLQIGEMFYRNTSLGYGSLENTDSLELMEHQNELRFFINLTQSYGLDSVYYRYKLDNQEWVHSSTNIVEIKELGFGKHIMNLEAYGDGELLDQKQMYINRFTPWYKKWTNILFGSFLFLGISYFVYLFRIKEIKERERLRADYEIKIAKLNAQALRSQMNPHFIFNTLNSIKHFSIFRSKEETSDYITDFSVLIRAILDSSDNNEIPLREEIDLLKTYLRIEKNRFSDIFKVSFNIEENLDIDYQLIPSMILQPFVENAIWHGLRYKDGDKRLTVSFMALANGYICEIIDNGIGRVASAKLNAGKSIKSKGVNISMDRIAYTQQNSEYNYSFRIVDLYQEDLAIGTKVIFEAQKK